MVHLVFVVDDDDFLERLRDEELSAEELESYARESSPSCFAMTTETDVDSHRLLEIVGVRWSEDAEVEDLNGVVKLLDEDAAELAVAKLEAFVERPRDSARRLATILAEEFAAEVDEEALDAIASALEEQDAIGVPEDDSETEAATLMVVQHLQALRAAAEHELWLATTSYVQ